LQEGVGSCKVQFGCVAIYDITESTNFQYIIQENFEKNHLTETYTFL